MPNPEIATYYPRGVNNYVEGAQYHSEVSSNSQARARLGAPPAANPAGYFTGVSVATALVGYNTFAAAYLPSYQSNGICLYGRGVSVTASGAYTGTVIIHGRDYLGQPMSESLAANGTTQVNGKKAFGYIDSVDVPTAAAGVTINVGWTDVLGLPFNSRALVNETVNFVATANPGTFLSSNIASPQTLTSADPRGTYTPAAANATNGSNAYQLLLMVDKANLYGVRHSYV